MHRPDGRAHLGGAILRHGAGHPPRCLYVDPAECSRDAVRQHGTCGIKAGGVRSRRGGLPFCLAAPSGVLQCSYGDRAACDQDAERHGAVCVQAPAPAGRYGIARPY